MPITQERMMKLVKAGQDYMAALENCSVVINQAIVDFNSKRIDLQGLFLTLSTLTKPLGLLDDPVHSYHTILEEARHFQKFKHRNDYERRKQAERRGKDNPSSTFRNKSAPPVLQAEPINEQALINMTDSLAEVEVDVVGIMGIELPTDRRSDLDKEVDAMLARQEKNKPE